MYRIVAHPPPRRQFTCEEVYDVRRQGGAVTRSGDLGLIALWSQRVLPGELDQASKRVPQSDFVTKRTMHQTSKSVSENALKNRDCFKMVPIANGLLNVRE